MFFHCSESSLKTPQEKQLSSLGIRKNCASPEERLCFPPVNPGILLPFMFPSFLWLFRSSEPTVCWHPSAWSDVILELFLPLVLYFLQLPQRPILSFCIFVLLSLVWKLLWIGVQKRNKIKVFVQRLMTCTHVPSSGESDNYQNRIPRFFRFVFAGKKSEWDGWKATETETTSLCALSRKRDC